MVNPEDIQALLPVRGKEVLPQELDAGYLSNLDALNQRTEQSQLRNLLDSMESRGFFRSGQTLQEVVDQILGPSLQRRQAALFPLAQQGALAGREERLGELGFQRQRQFAREQHTRNLEFLRKQADIQRELLDLQANLSNPGTNFGSIFGQAAGIGLGSLFGGFGAGIGGSIGRRVGGIFDKKPRNAVPRSRNPFGEEFEPGGF